MRLAGTGSTGDYNDRVTHRGFISSKLSLLKPGAVCWFNSDWIYVMSVQLKALIDLTLHLNVTCEGNGIAIDDGVAVLIDGGGARRAFSARDGVGARTVRRLAKSVVCEAIAPALRP